MGILGRRSRRFEHEKQESDDIDRMLFPPALEVDTRARYSRFRERTMLTDVTWRDLAEFSRGVREKADAEEDRRSAGIGASAQPGEAVFRALPTDIRIWALGAESGIANASGRSWREACLNSDDAPLTGKEFHVTISILECAPVLKHAEAEGVEKESLSAVWGSRRRRFTLRRIGAHAAGGYHGPDGLAFRAGRTFLAGETTVSYYVGDDAKTGVVFWCAVPICRLSG